VKASIRDADLILTGLPFENALLLGMLTKQLSADELGLLIRSSKTASGLPGISYISLQLGNKVMPLLNGICDDPVALEQLERLAFQQVPFAVYLRAPFCVTGVEAFRQTAGVTTWEPEERAAIEEFLNESLDHYGQGKLSFTHFSCALAAWEGLIGEFGWQGLARDLPPTMRGPLAYLIGLRLVAKGRHADAEPLFIMASQDLPADSPLQAHVHRAQQKLPPAVPKS
jgi:hypothetical protein